MLLQHNCDFCGKEFEIDAQRLKNTNICCSRECAASLKKAMKENNVTCYACKIPFYMKPSQLALRKYPDKVTCSLECSKVARSKRSTGEGNHQYGLRGELNSSFKSDIMVSTYGYILIRNIGHPEAMYNGYMFLHRLVMEEYLRTTEQYEYLREQNGFLVLPNEFIVHHKDENKFNNTLSNLEVLYLGEHTALHHELVGGHLKNTKTKGTLSAGTLTKKHKIDAGLDVSSSEEVIIKAWNSAVISTGLHINVPEGYVGLLWSRSGLSVKYKLEVGAGCIDSGYTGEVKVHLYNHGLEDYKVNIGDRIAQLLTIPVLLEEYIEVDNLEESTRGTGGFGSTDQQDLLGR